MSVSTHLVNLQPFRLTDDGIQFTEIEIYEEMPMAVAFYTVNGKTQEYGLRLDIGKVAFLDIDPFEERWGEAEGRQRANALAAAIVKHLAAQPSQLAATHGD
jgi:hypothetical protein